MVSESEKILRTAVAVLLSVLTLIGADNERAAANLPAGAALARIPARNWTPQSPNMEPAVVSGPISSATTRDLAFVYRLSGSLFLRVVAGGAPHEVVLDSQLPGDYAQSSASVQGVYPTGITSPRPITLQDLTASGRDDIAVLSSSGASLGTYLSIFSVEDSRLKNLVSGGVIGGDAFQFDCAPGRPCRIISYGRWTNLESSWVHTYEWLGTLFVMTERGTESYLQSRLRSLAESALSERPQAVPRRVQVATLAASIYVEHRQPEAAVEVCNAALSILSDPAKSVGRTNGIDASAADKALQSDLRKGQAALHECLAKSYGAEGRVSESVAEHEMARRLSSSQPK